MKRLSISFLVTLFLLSGVQAFARPAASISQDCYVDSLEQIRNLEIIVSNFGTDQEKADFNKIKDKFRQASAKHLSQEYLYSYSLDFPKKEETAATADPATATTDSAVTTNEKNVKKAKDRQKESSIYLYISLKNDLINLLDGICQTYLTRTEKILDSTARDSFDIFIKYNKNNGLAKFFFQPFDPLKDSKPYIASEYHFYRDKSTISEYLKRGYSLYQLAFKAYENPYTQELKAKENKTIYELNYVLDKYMGVVSICRQSKQCGIEIHKILKIQQLDEILMRYDVIAKNLKPIYDDRIPSQFKIDAVDNQIDLFEVEQKRLIVKEKKLTE